MKIAIVGCGFVADLYMLSLALHPKLQVVAAMDIVPSQAQRFGDYWKVPVVHSVEALLSGYEFDMVLNLTNPGSHYEVSKAFLKRGKHVYSEKPLAMRYEEAEELLAVAKAANVRIASAPCNHLGESAQAIARELAQGAPVGKPRVVYAEIDDGYVPLAPYRNWKSNSGAPWPYKDEFEVGCTLEHAGYYLTWLMAMFGPVEEVHAFASVQHPDKVPDMEYESADFSVACLRFRNGMVARLTCSVLAPKDHRFRIVGDKGVLTAENCWFYTTPTYVQEYRTIRRRFMLWPFKKKIALKPTGPKMGRWGAAAMDFARGPAELANAIGANRRSRVAEDFCLHFNEVTLAIHYADREPGPYRVRSTFAPLELVDEPIL